MGNPTLMLITAVFKSLYNKLNNIYTMVCVLKQKTKKWENMSISRIITHCLYEHEMENVPYYVNASTRAIVITIAALAIYHNANKQKYRPEE